MHLACICLQGHQASLSLSALMHVPPARLYTAPKCAALQKNAQNNIYSKFAF